MSTDAATSNALPDEATLPDDPETLKGMIRELLALLHNRDQELSGVRQRLDQLLRRLYGPKGEHFRPDQPSLFEGAAEPAAASPNTPVHVEPEPVTSAKKKGHGRRRLPADLNRERVVHDVPDAEKVCPCCSAPRVKIGEETSEQLDYRPAKLFVWEHVRLKYACPKCLKATSETTPIRDFYRVEDEARDLIARQQLVGDAADAVRWQLRQERTKAKLTAFAAWLEDQAPRVLPKSPIGQAIAYARRQWSALQRFTEHGFLNIDNNASARALRAVALGRKNWLFAGSDKGGKTAAVLYTITQMCRRHGIDPFVYLQDVLTRLPLSTSDDLPSFLPNRWAAQRASAEETARSIPRLVADSSPRRRHWGSPDAYAYRSKAPRKSVNSLSG